VETVMMLLLAPAHLASTRWSTVRQPGQRGAIRAG
jgi:hypothetical protein